MSVRATVRALAAAAAAFYRAAGPLAFRFARGKLAADPVYAALLAQGLLAGRERILDLGCGQGLLAAWLLAAAAHPAREPSHWPRGWPAPPQPKAYWGIDINAREVARARRAFALDPGVRLTLVHGDLRDAELPPADAIVILDVLHYLDPAGQERVLEHVRGALAPGGVLLVRVKDAGGGVRYLASRALDSTVAFARRGRRVPLHCRPLPEWLRLFARCGLAAETLPLTPGTGLADVLLRAAPA